VNLAVHPLGHGAPASMPLRFPSPGKLTLFVWGATFPVNI